MSELVLLEESSAVQCTGLSASRVSLRAGGNKNCITLADDLRYQAHCFDYHLDKINPEDACILAARLLLYAGNGICQACPNLTEVLDRIEEDRQLLRVWTQSPAGLR